MLPENGSTSKGSKGKFTWLFQIIILTAASFYVTLHSVERGSACNQWECHEYPMRSLKCMTLKNFKDELQTYVSPVQNYEEALKNLPYFSRAHMGRGKSLQALGRTTVRYSPHHNAASFDLQETKSVAFA